MPRFTAGGESPVGDWLVASPTGEESAGAVVTLDFEAPATEITPLGVDLHLTAVQLPADRLPAETIWQVVVDATAPATPALSAVSTPTNKATPRRTASHARAPRS